MVTRVRTAETTPRPMLRSDEIWSAVRAEAQAWRARAKVRDPIRALVDRIVLPDDDLASFLARVAVRDFGDAIVVEETFAHEFVTELRREPELVEEIVSDIAAYVERDPAAHGVLAVTLFAKGLQALMAHRVAHAIYREGRVPLALYVNARSTRVLGVDIHPAARFGRGIFIDHATGVVVGETAVVEDDVSILQGVTLGGTGKEARRQIIRRSRAASCWAPARRCSEAFASEPMPASARAASCCVRSRRTAPRSAFRHGSSITETRRLSSDLHGSI